MVEEIFDKLLMKQRINTFVKPTLCDDIKEFMLKINNKPAKIVFDNSRNKERNIL